MIYLVVAILFVLVLDFSLRIYNMATQADLTQAIDTLAVAVNNLETRAANQTVDLQPQVDAVNALTAKVDATLPA